MSKSARDDKKRRRFNKRLAGWVWGMIDAMIRQRVPLALSDLQRRVVEHEIEMKARGWW